MKAFQHFNARTIREASALIEKHRGNAKVNAGGTDLLGCLRDQCLEEYPEAVIDIKGIPGLDSIKAGARGVKIGALTKLVDLVQSPVLKEQYPLLVQAARSVAAPNIRNMATVGGNLAQEIRCWYFRYAKHIGGPITCLRKGGKGCNAVAGDNRYHSIFGAAPASEDSQTHQIRRGCFAIHPSDLAVALVALNATIVTNKRTLTAQDFFTANTIQTTVLEMGELIKGIRIPKPPKDSCQNFQKFTLREPIDFAVVSIASLITQKGEVCSNARIVLGGVAPSPARAIAAEEFLKGKTIDEAMAENAAQLAFADARPLSKNGFKIQIGQTLIRRSLKKRLIMA
jgi:xanthine dehydrogenase YagS FAD-binding subunit